MTEMNADSDAAHPGLPFACTLNPGAGSARRRRWRALADKGHPIVQRRGHQLEVRYRPEPGVPDELEALAAAERQCCKFTAWDVTQGGDHTVLLVTADPSTPDDVARMAGLLGADESPRA